MVRPIPEKLRILNDYLDAAEPPIRLIPLAEALGVKVYEAAWPDSVSGKIQRDQARGGPSGYAIYVKKDHPPRRKRFTIAHELAHYVLHEEAIGDGVFDDALYRSGLSNTQETQANSLAADILMPWRHLRGFVDKYGDDVARLADAFNVSRNAMSIRIGVPYDG